MTGKNIRIITDIMEISAIFYYDQWRKFNLIIWGEVYFSVFAETKVNLTAFEKIFF